MAEVQQADKKWWAKALLVGAVVGFVCLPLGALGTLFPKPQPCYIGFGEPIDLAKHKGKKLTKAQLKRLRGEVAEQIEEQLAELLLIREQTRREDGLLRRILSL